MNYDQETITVSTFGDLLGNEDHNVNPFSTVNEINNSSSNSFNENLGSWAVECNIPNASVNKLLKIMKKQDNINTQDLPYDSRTLLATLKPTERFIRTVIPGSYYHFGLAEGIRRYATSSLTEIKIAIGVDGLHLN